jgi:hypothetical protein
MNMAFRAVALLGLTLFCWVGLAAAQDLHPSRRPSPMGTARITLEDTYVRVVYSRPYKRGRDNIFGTADSDALVPFDKIWRTGANEATEMTSTGDLMVSGQKLAAGTYSIFTTPGETSWKIHLNSSLGLSGTGFFDPKTEKFVAADLPATDVLVLEVNVGVLEEEVDQFTIEFAATDDGADMCLSWVTTQLCIPVSTP